MRIFWALIAVLILGAAGVPLLKSFTARMSSEKAREELDRTRAIVDRERRAIESDVRRSLDETDAAANAQATAPPTTPTPATSQAESPGATLPAAKAADPSPEPQVGKGGVPDPLDTPIDATPQSTPSDLKPADEKHTPAPAIAEPQPTNPARPNPEDKPTLPESVTPPPISTTSIPSPTVSSEANPTPVAPTPTPATGAPVSASSTPSTPEDTPAAQEAPKIVKKDDGSMLVDDRFVVKGEGTAEKPYEITWELLVSAQESYDPRIGRKKLPGRVMMLDGKYVRINGHIAYPLFVEQPRECLTMLNQWDGCCIGVPPTPYDAVEVRLKKTVDPDLKMATYGVIEGKMGVKPYLAGDWLVGLYVMEQASLAATQQDRSGQ